MIQIVIIDTIGRYDALGNVHLFFILQLVIEHRIWLIKSLYGIPCTTSGLIVDVAFWFSWHTKHV